MDLTIGLLSAPSVYSSRFGCFFHKLAILCKCIVFLGGGTIANNLSAQSSNGVTLPQEQQVPENLSYDNPTSQIEIVLGVTEGGKDGTENHLGKKIRNISAKDDWHKLPEKGELTDVKYETIDFPWRRQWVVYTPSPHAEGDDSFIWTATDEDGFEHNYTCLIKIVPTSSAPLIFLQGELQPLGASEEVSFEEEQNIVAKMEILDPDPSFLQSNVSNLQVSLSGEHMNFFRLPDNLPTPKLVGAKTATGKNGWSWEFPILWNNDSLPNYETMPVKDFEVSLNVIDATGKTASTSLAVSVANKPEGPQLAKDPEVVAVGDQALYAPDAASSAYFGLRKQEFTLVEGGDLNISIPFSIYAPDQRSDGSFKDYKIYYEANRTKLQNGSLVPPKLETVQVGFTQTAEANVTQVDSLGRVTQFEITNPGYGYLMEDAPLVAIHSRSNDENESLHLSFNLRSSPIDLPLLPGTLRKELLEVNQSDPGFEVGDAFSLGYPTNLNFQTLGVGDKNASRLAPSYSDGILLIDFPIADSFQEKITYRFYAQDESDKVFSDKAGKSIPFLTLSVRIANQYEDPISLETVFPRLSSSDGILEPHYLSSLEHSLDLLADLNATDPDTSPLVGERSDKESNREGARIIYDVSWDYERLDPDFPFREESADSFFRITQTGLLYFKDPEDLPINLRSELRKMYLDYDEILKPTTAAQAHLQWPIVVEVADASSQDSVSHKRSTASQRFTIEIKDQPEDSLYVNNAGKPLENLPTYYIKTKEGETWSYPESVYPDLLDENDTTILLYAKDFDSKKFLSSNYFDPVWKEEPITDRDTPVLGAVTIIEQKPPVDGIVELAKFSYTPRANRSGTDYFDLGFGNDKQRIRFVIEIENTADKPTAGSFRIFDDGGVGFPEIVPPNPEGNVFTGLILSETINRIFELTFVDEQDFDAIDTVEFFGADRDLFLIEEVGDDGSKPWRKTVRISLKELLDREKYPEHEDPIFDLKVLVEDSSPNYPENQNRYDFVFTLPDEDEGPEITADGKPSDQVIHVTENSLVAVEKLEAKDPEGEDKVFEWDIAGGAHADFFELESSRGSSVRLLFAPGRSPNYEKEEQRDLNVTLLVSDGEEFGYHPLVFRVDDDNDLPTLIVPSLEVFEPQRLVIDDLRSIFTDEDEDELTFLLLGGPGRGSHADLFDANLVASKGELRFKADSDHERNSTYRITLRAKDGNFSHSESNLTILVENVNEAPQVRRGVRNQADPDAPLEYSINEKLLTHYTFEGEEALQEETEKAIDFLYFFDPEDATPNPSSLTYEVIGEALGSFTIFPSPNNPDGTFRYTPPDNYYNTVNGELIDELLSIDLNVTDKDGASSIFTFFFAVEDMEDPPRIIPLVEDEEVTEVNTEARPWGVINYEGNLDVMILLADDSVDPEPSANFKWELQGRDKDLFQLVFRRPNEQFLRWKPSDEIENLNPGQTPNWGSPPINPGLSDFQEAGTYELTVKVWDQFDENSTSSVDLILEIGNLLDRPPEFIPYSSSGILETLPFEEESADAFIANILAVDPDAQEMESAGLEKHLIVYELDDQSRIYTDWKWIDKEAFETDPFQPTNRPGGELRFLKVPDYEADFVDKGLEPRLEFRIWAREYDENGPVPDAETSQIVRIPIKNKVEEPAFLSLGNQAEDANFSILEGEVGLFEVHATTEDFNKSLVIQLNSEVADGHLFEKVRQSPPADGVSAFAFAFVSPPDRESPRDHDKDNRYEVQLEIATSDPMVFHRETFFIKVEDTESPFSIESDAYFQIEENTRFVVDLEVEDEENEQVSADLLFVTEKGAFYAPNSNLDHRQNPIFSSALTYEVHNALDSLDATAADFNNDGSQDLIVLAGRSASLRMNLGFGTFGEPVDFSVVFPAPPRDALAGDFDQDGDQDFLVSYHGDDLASQCGIWFYRNPGDGSFPPSPEEVSLPVAPPLLQQPGQLAALDADGDYDLDLVVTDRPGGRVFWIANDGRGNFASPKVLAENLTEPRRVEPFNASSATATRSSDPFGKKDLLIGGKGKIWVARSNGSGEFVSEEAVSLSSGARFVRSVKPVDLNEDELPDLVYIDNESAGPFFAIQKKSEEEPFGPSYSFGHPTLNSRSLEVFFDEANQSAKPVVLVGALGPALYQFPSPVETGLAAGVNFGEPRKLTFPTIDEGGIKEMKIVDLDRAYNHFHFSLDETSFQFEVFDEKRFRDGGRLFFKDSPDFENPVIPGLDNLFQVRVQYTKFNQSTGSAQSKTKLIEVQVVDVNEAPLITQSPLVEIPENHLSVWQELLVENPESAFEELRFSLSGPDEEFFDIDSRTGGLSFKERHRWDDREDADEDSNYSVRIKMEEVGRDPPFVEERDFVVRLLDGYEVPLAPKLDLNYSLVEDGLPLVIHLQDFNVTDHPDNHENGIVSASVDKQGHLGKAEIQESLVGDELEGLFSYQPDANASGSDLVSVKFLNKLGLPVHLNLHLSIAPVDDAPVPRTPNLILHPEGDLNVTLLEAFDSDLSQGGNLSWHLADPEDPDFSVVGGRFLFFNYKTDYETQKDVDFVARLLIRDGVGPDVPYSILVQLTDLSDELPQSVLSSESPNLFRVIEREFQVVDLELFDPDLGDLPTARVSGGPDSRFFQVVNGWLRIKEAFTLDHGFPQDENKDNLYELNLEVMGGKNSKDYPVFVRVLDKDDNPPVFINLPLSQREGNRSVYEVPENQRFVAYLKAEDKEGGALAFAISGGADREQFELNSKTGELRFKEPKNYEQSIEYVEEVLIAFPFELEVQVTDGFWVTKQALAVYLTDRNDLPVLESREYFLMEDETLSGVLSLSDEDGSADSVVAQILRKPKRGSLSLDSNSRAFTYVPQPNFFGVDDFQVSLRDDANGTSSFEVKLSISSVNDPPVAVDDFLYYFAPEDNTTAFVEFSVLANDRTGEDDSAESASYEVEVIENPQGSLVARPTPGVFSYAPPADFLGPDAFSYHLLDGNLLDSGNAVVWVATTANLPQWTSLKNFGTFYRNSKDSPWIYHRKMGWLYLSEFDDLLDATWMWHELIGWFWTGDWLADENRLRWVYSNALKEWLHWEGGIRDAGGWFLRSYENEIFDEDFFVRLGIRMEILEILPDLRGLSSYLEELTYFKRSEIIDIKLELNRYKRSNTLDRILQFAFPY